MKNEDGLSPLPLHVQLSRESYDGVQEYSSSNWTNPSFPLWIICHLLPNSKYASENTDCLHGLIVSVASEGLVFYFIPTFKNLILFLILPASETSEAIGILKCRHVPPRGNSYQLIPKPKHFMISLKPQPQNSSLHQPHPHRFQAEKLPLWISAPPVPRHTVPHPTMAATVVFSKYIYQFR